MDGTSNTAVGAAALRDNISGDDNQAFGRGALRFTTGNDNIGIGREAGANQTYRAIYNVISIGSPAMPLPSTQVTDAYIGNIRGWQ